jgi:hypothetical protein
VKVFAAEAGGWAASGVGAAAVAADTDGTAGSVAGVLGWTDAGAEAGSGAGAGV